DRAPPLGHARARAADRSAGTRQDARRPRQRGVTRAPATFRLRKCYGGPALASAQAGSLPLLSQTLFNTAKLGRRDARVALQSHHLIAGQSGLVATATYPEESVCALAVRSLSPHRPVLVTLA